MPTLYLFAIRFSFCLSPLAYRYMGNNYTNGTNNVPGADINCSIFLFSLLKMKSLGFCWKAFFFFSSQPYQMIWLSQRLLSDSEGQSGSFTVFQRCTMQGSPICRQQAHTLSHFTPIVDNKPLELWQMPWTMGAPHCVNSQSGFSSGKKIFKGKKKNTTPPNPILLLFFSCILIQSCPSNNFLMKHILRECFAHCVSKLRAKVIFPPASLGRTTVSFCSNSS